MDFVQIEDGIIAALKAQVTYLKTVETYAGQLERDIDSLPLRFPAAFVAYSGSDFTPGAAGRANPGENVTFSVFVCARNLRGSEAARKDEQGAYDAVKDILGALVNNDLGLAIDALRPARCSLLYAGGEAAVYAVDLKTGFEGAYQ